MPFASGDEVPSARLRAGLRFAQDDMTHLDIVQEAKGHFRALWRPKIKPITLSDPQVILDNIQELLIVTLVFFPGESAMSGPGRQTLRQPVDRNISRVRQDGAAGSSCATQSIERECPSSETAKTSGGKGGNAGNRQSLGISGLFDPAAKRRKPAETGGNPLQRLCSRNCPQFCCLTFGVHYKSLAEIAEIPCRNLLTARLSHVWRPLP
jgi:hypothetical protein